MQADLIIKDSPQGGQRGSPPPARAPLIIVYSIIEMFLGKTELFNKAALKCILFMFDLRPFPHPIPPHYTYPTPLGRFYPPPYLFLNGDTISLSSLHVIPKIISYYAPIQLSV